MSDLNENDHTVPDLEKSSEATPPHQPEEGANAEAVVPPGPGLQPDSSSDVPNPNAPPTASGVVTQTLPPGSVDKTQTSEATPPSSVDSGSSGAGDVPSPVPSVTSAAGDVPSPVPSVTSTSEVADADASVEREPEPVAGPSGSTGTPPSAEAIKSPLLLEMLNAPPLIEEPFIEIGQLIHSTTGNPPPLPPQLSPAVASSSSRQYVPPPQPSSLSESPPQTVPTSSMPKSPKKDPVYCDYCGRNKDSAALSSCKCIESMAGDQRPRASSTSDSFPAQDPPRRKLTPKKMSPCKSLESVGRSSEASPGSRASPFSPKRKLHDTREFEPLALDDPSGAKGSSTGKSATKRPSPLVTPEETAAKTLKIQSESADEEEIISPIKKCRMMEVEPSPSVQVASPHSTSVEVVESPESMNVSSPEAGKADSSEAMHVTSPRSTRLVSTESMEAASPHSTSVEMQVEDESTKTDETRKNLAEMKISKKKQDGDDDTMDSDSDESKKQ